MKMSTACLCVYSFHGAWWSCGKTLAFRSRGVGFDTTSMTELHSWVKRLPLIASPHPGVKWTSVRDEMGTSEERQLYHVPLLPRCRLSEDVRWCFSLRAWEGEGRKWGRQMETKGRQMDIRRHRHTHIHTPTYMYTLARAHTHTQRERERGGEGEEAVSKHLASTLHKDYKVCIQCINKSQ